MTPHAVMQVFTATALRFSMAKDYLATVAASRQPLTYPVTLSAKFTALRYSAGVGASGVPSVVPTSPTGSSTDPSLGQRATPVNTSSLSKFMMVTP